MPRVHLTALLVAASCLAQNALAARNPETTVEQANQVLHEIMSIPMRQIPRHLLAEAEGIAIIPDVIKVGFVGGLRRGRGVVLVRDREGDWGLPQFVILTGGSVGWQAGIQATDVILVFRTKKSIEGLLGGKFTLGVGGSVAAGPLGRSAEAATDAALKAEILSYSRGRGVFAGVAVDGSALEIDADYHIAFYGSPPNALPMVVPEPALRLQAEVASLTGGSEYNQPPLPVVADRAAPATDAARKQLAENSSRLSGLLSPQWRQYLALPADVYAENRSPSVDAVKASLGQFDRVAADSKYRGLSERVEFQATHESLRNYLKQLIAVPAAPLELPPPPSEGQPAPRP